MSHDRKRLFIVDGPNLVFRAHFAIGPMTNSQQFPVNALFGFTNMLIRLIEEERPDYLAIAWDPPGPTFRHEIFEAYKGTRPDIPDSLRRQLPWVERIAEAFEVPFLCVEGYEADDVMGTLARRYRDELDVVLVSSDKDLMQLIDAHVTMLDTMKDRVFTPAEVRAKFGCDPPQVPDALALLGDSSDNIPGVKGIGEKGVKKLFSNFGSLREMYERLEEVTPPRTRKLLAQQRDRACLSRRLATITTDVPIDVDLATLALTYPPDADRVRPLLQDLEFRTLLRRFGGSMQTVSRDDYRLVDSEEGLAELVAALERGDRFALDVETDSLDPDAARLVGLSFCADETRAWYLPLGHRLAPEGAQLSWELVRESLRPLLEDARWGKIGQNIKYDMRVLAAHGVEVRGIVSDTMVAAYLLNPDRRAHGLDDLALTYLHHRTVRYEDVVPKGETFDAVPLEVALRYAAEDAHVTWLLEGKLRPALGRASLQELYEELEVPLIPVLARMEARGIALDVEALGTLATELGEQIEGAVKRCYELAGEEFNIGSVPQLRAILFDKLGLPVLKKTKTGPSTAESVLKKLAEEHPLPAAILEVRRLVKLKNTYVDPLPKLVSPRTGRLHTTYSQVAAATGRLASVHPNLQNIPVRTEWGQRIRRAFVAPAGRRLVSLDYSQIELRVLAHLVGGRGGLAEAFAAGRDVHAQTAARIFDVPLDAVDSEQRRIAKAVNFGIIYGQGPHGLAQSLGIGRSEAREIIRRHGERFPEVEAFRRETLAAARRDGYVRTLLGRRRYISGLNSRDHNERAAAERAAINTPVQGSAADIIKRAMIDIDRFLSEDPRQWMLLQVHDELVFEVDEEAIDRLVPELRRRMVEAVSLSLPLEVDVGVGRSWDEAH